MDVQGADLLVAIRAVLAATAELSRACEALAEALQRALLAGPATPAPPARPEPPAGRAQRAGDGRVP